MIYQPTSYPLTSLGHPFHHHLPPHPGHRQPPTTPTPSIPAAYRTPIPPPVPYACVLAAGADHVRDQLPVLVEDEDPQIEQHMVLMDRIMEGEIGRGQTSGGV